MKYLTLVGEMAKRQITKKDLSDLLGVHWNSITNKISGESDFSVTEAIKIRDRYFSEWRIEDLFNRTSDQ